MVRSLKDFYTESLEEIKRKLEGVVEIASSIDRNTEYKAKDPQGLNIHKGINLPLSSILGTLAVIITGMKENLKEDDSVLGYGSAKESKFVISNLLNESENLLRLHDEA